MNKKLNIVIAIVITIILAGGTFLFAKANNETQNDDVLNRKELLYNGDYSKVVAEKYIFTETEFYGHLYIIIENKKTHQFVVLHDPDCWDMNGLGTDDVDYD